LASGTERTTTVSEYVVIYEQGPTSWGAYCPDLPGLGTAGKTRKEVERLIHEAIELHVESLREHGEPVPPPTSAAGMIAVGAA
jgi:predicted RNase H-like HicB family nuclease